MEHVNRHFEMREVVIADRPMVYRLVRARHAEHRVAPPERWRAALARARVRGAFLGTRAKAFPEDFAVFARFHRALSALPERHPVPDPLPLAEGEQLIAQVNAARSAR